MSRTARHIILFLASAATGALFYSGLQSDRLVYTVSMASAYGSLVLLALSLMIGPWNKLRGRPNPISGYLRRDIGIWAGILGIVHVVAGLQVHMGKIALYFLPPGIATFPFPMSIGQWMPFGLTNYAGLGATLILLLLLSLSNDVSLRTLGASRWKSLQRWNYAGALLVIAHGVAYQVIEKRTITFVEAFAAIVLVALAMQFAGYHVSKKKT